MAFPLATHNDPDSLDTLPAPRQDHENIDDTPAIDGLDDLLLPPPPPPLPRRTLSRLRLRSLYSHRRLSETTFNPEAAEFRPSASMPATKRKASSSADKPGKSIAKTPSIPKGLPIVATKDIFGTPRAAGQPNRPNQSTVPSLPGASARNLDIVDLTNSSSDDNEDEYELWQPPSTAISRALPAGDPAAEHVRLRSNSVIMVRRPPVDRGDGTPSDDSRKLSVILVSRDAAPDSAQLRFLPLGPLPSAATRSQVHENDSLTILPDYREKIYQSYDQAAQPNVIWPTQELPLELFDAITSYLSRDDVKSMRLVNHEFEQKVSRSLFHTSVVPFNTELYDMIDEDQRHSGQSSGSISNKSKGKAPALHDITSLSQADAHTLKWQNAKEDKEGKVYRGYGLRVFRGFGPHIKRFGMSFEVSERQLSQTLSKKELDHVQSYYGSYDWPSKEYARFANLAGLENTADETSRMKAAFANLEIVRELALCIDSGLGWLNGPDRSLRSRLFERPSAVFGSTYVVPDHATRATTDLWAALQQSQQAFDPWSNMQEIQLDGRPTRPSPSELIGIDGTPFADTQRWPAIQCAPMSSPERLPQIPSSGVIFTTNDCYESSKHNPANGPLVPATLKKEQKEWLLETQWAQQAFLESYMLAVIDNPTNFGKVTTLNIAKLPSRFLSMLSRPYFWDALPCLSAVTLRVNADWRSVDKDETGAVELKPEYPSRAIRTFHQDVLRDRISLRQSIKKLTMGWVGGGEHAEGVYSRNSNVLPAPITSVEHSVVNSSLFGLVFKHVEHLTLSNCWITPPALEGLIKSHAGLALKKLTLESVSLTTHPKFPPNANAGNLHQLQQMLAGMPGQAAATLQQGLLQAQGPNFGLQAQQLQQIQQQFQAHMQQMQNLFQINAAPNLAQAAIAQAQAIAQPQAQPNAPANPVLHPLNLANFPPLPPAPGQLPNAMAMPVANGAPAAIGNNIAALVPGHWSEGHREGSWPELLNIITPGPTFTDYLPAPQPWEQQPEPRSTTNLQTIELDSCGYIKLPRLFSFDQTAFDVLPRRPGRVPSDNGMSPWFLKRSAALAGTMMEAKDRFLGQIVQAMPQRELNAVQFAWGLREGWTDESKADEATYDGRLPGGTGRISGIITKDMGLIGQPSAVPFQGGH